MVHKTTLFINIYQENNIMIRKSLGVRKHLINFSTELIKFFFDILL